MGSQDIQKQIIEFFLFFGKRGLNAISQKGKQAAIFCLVMILFASGILCIRDRNVPVIPSENGKKDGPVEDTTRIYLNPNTGDTLEIYPKAVYVRYFPWVEDTNKIMELICRHGLRLYYPLFREGEQWRSILCINDSRRAEYHFTPYGKDGFNNFGADSLVEYSFGFFGNGSYFPDGSIVFKFLEGTTQSKIDSLFETKGLRFLTIRPDYPNGYRYWTIITPEATRNIIDLGWELKSVSFIEYATVNFYTTSSSVQCEAAKKRACHEKSTIIRSGPWIIH